MTIQELFKGKVFITDLGAPQLAEKGDEKIEVGRYAVWSPFQEPAEGMAKLSSIFASVIEPISK